MQKNTANRDRLRGRNNAKNEESRDFSSSRAWKLVNSGFAIWLLTTVLVGSLSAYWTTRQECRKSFSDAENRLVRALSEYQYRQHRYSESMRTAKTTEERQEAEKWLGNAMISSQDAYRDRTMVDISLDMLRAFGDLSLVSDIESFDIVGTALSISHGDRSSVVLVNPDPTALASLKFPLKPQGLSSPDAAKTTNGQPSRLRERMYVGDPVLNAVRTAAMLKPSQQCGPIDILKREFVSDNEAYRRQVNRLFDAMQKKQQTEMLQLLAIDALVSPEKVNGK